MDNTKKLERLEYEKVVRTTHNWWWESHANPRNAKWLSSSLEEMDRNTAHMLKLIDDDGDSFAKKADLYYKRRPELIDQVHELQRMYRTLAERYEQLTVDLQRNVSTDMHLHPPVASDLESEPSTPRALPDLRLNRYRSNRAAGFDYFLGNNSERSREVSPGPDFEEPGVSSVHSSPRISVSRSEEVMNEKATQMDSELNNDKEKTEIPEKENVGLLELQLKVASYEVETAKLKTELETVRSLNLSNYKRLKKTTTAPTLNNESEMDVKQIQEAEEDHHSTDITVSDPEKVRAVFEELKVTKGRLHNIEVEHEKLSTENKSAYERIHQLQDQIKEAKKDAAGLRLKFDTEMIKASKREDKISRLKGSLIDCDAEIKRLKDMIADADKKYPPQAELSRLTTEKDQVEVKHRELEVHCQTLKNQHAEVEKKLSDEIELLKVGNENREQLEALKNDLDELKLKYDSLMSERDELIAEAGSSNELKVRIGELQEEVERQKVLISETAEEKREAIRQLCFSLEHYRKGYKQLREVTTEHIVLPVLLAS